jgi:ABC-type transport system involved in cytochrome bd biosynthesis fused ATPase/permease subunit
MTDPFAILTIAVAGLAAVGILAAAGLAGWSGWLRLQHAALAPAGRATSPEDIAPAQRIELADLRERVRKLEAIAAGVEL